MWKYAASLFHTPAVADCMTDRPETYATDVFLTIKRLNGPRWTLQSYSEFHTRDWNPPPVFSFFPLLLTVFAFSCFAGMSSRFLSRLFNRLLTHLFVFFGTVLKNSFHSDLTGWDTRLPFGIVAFEGFAAKKSRFRLFQVGTRIRNAWNEQQQYGQQPNVNWYPGMFKHYKI